MDFKITRENFLEALSKTQGVVERKNTMPVLSNILLDADKGGVKISATDLEVALVTLAPAQVLKTGKITVAARSLYDIVREINQPEIRVVLQDNDRIEVSAGKSHFKIPGLSAAEFPQLPAVAAKSVEFQCDVFSRMIEKTSFSMSTDETRHNLAGILFQRAGSSGVRMVATDGHRLAMVDAEGNGGEGDFKVIIPKKGVAELKKLVSKEGTFELAVGPANLFARKGNESLYIRLIDGEFPDYSRVIPKDNAKFVYIPRDKFVGSLRRVSLLANERSRGVILSFSPAHLEVSINNPDLGEAREELEADYKGEKLSIGFNARYFLDALEVMKDETAILALNTDLSPCILKSEKDSGFLAVIMPMRI
ncbi:MAG: DNA polymerase III subunit beta [Deltaproteobacteria bacterium]|nr:DNA polymerase III subunit beta [Deltaproteobacteria bacterium]